MENQHRKIKGYRELDGGEIERMNVVKRLEESVMEIIEAEQGSINSNTEGAADPRWLAIAKTDLQKGFMAFGRAIARPDGY
jgi:hypothetical protein